jgi:hypothetical protein
MGNNVDIVGHRSWTTISRAQIPIYINFKYWHITYTIRILSYRISNPVSGSNLTGSIL